jgi:hypothetical protein
LRETVKLSTPASGKTAAFKNKAAPPSYLLPAREIMRVSVNKN